jgi:hypothetical protein
MVLNEMEFDSYLTKEKGWIKSKSGYEYVYDYTLKQIPSVMIKVLSSVNTGEGKSNKGSHAIRVFAVKVDKDGKILRGYIKKQVVHLTATWRKDLLISYKIVMCQVAVRARKEGLI